MSDIKVPEELLVECVRVLKDQLQDIRSERDSAYRETPAPHVIRVLELLLADKSQKETNTTLVARGVVREQQVGDPPQGMFGMVFHQFEKLWEFHRPDGTKVPLRGLHSARQDVVGVMIEMVGAANAARHQLVAMKGAADDLASEFEAMRGVLQTAQAGLQWYADRFPEAADGSDDEMHAEIDITLAETAPQQEGKSEDLDEEALRFGRFVFKIMCDKVDRTNAEWHAFCRPFVRLNGSHEMPNYPGICRAVLDELKKVK